MSLKTITFRLSEEKLQALDSAADVQQRDRSFIINEAVTQYLSLYEYHRALIEEGIRQDDAGDVVDHETVVEMVAGLISKRTKRH
jgi:predicted transcriptional regulator